MKTSEMNAHEKLAFRFICESMSDIIGGYENSLIDNEEDSEEYKNAYDFLHSGHEALIDFIYYDVMASADKGTAKHMRFAGEAFIRERISKRLTKWGY